MTQITRDSTKTNFVQFFIATPILNRRNSGITIVTKFFANLNFSRDSIFHGTQLRMVVSTRSNREKVILDRILEEVLGLDPTDPIVLAFQHNTITKVNQLLLLTSEQFANLVYQEAFESSPAKLLGPVQAATVYSLTMWFRAQPNPSLGIWSALTEDSFSNCNDYCRRCTS